MQHYLQDRRTQVRTQDKVWHCLVAGASAFLVFAGSLSAQPTVTQFAMEPSSAAQSTVTLDVRDSTISYVIHTIARQAKLRLFYEDANKELARRVSVRFIKSNVMDAMAAALKGTSLTATLASDQETIVIRPRTDTTSSRQARGTQEQGSITGKVTDSASGNGLKGVTVRIEGTDITVTTDPNGMYTLRNVPNGEHLVIARVFGFKVASRRVSVTEGKMVVQPFRLIPVATALSEVVTTAAGQEQRLKVPNDVVKLNVDSVLKTAPVSTMSELLSMRVPGVVVQKTSGEPGAPSVIRIRGTNSLTLNNDPIIIVDGSRIYSSVSNVYDANQAVRSAQASKDLTPTTRAWDLARNKISQNTAPSPLDQINPNSIETVEILRGPSAAALYGTDAANGIIVITTKRGRAGPPQWALNMDQGIMTMPGTYPLNYRRWGRTYDGLDVQCYYLKNITAGGERRCATIDSLSVYQALNDDRTTMFGRGTNQRYGAEVRGGSQTLTYALRANTRHEIGYLKLPDLEVAKVERFTGNPVPSWQRRPQRSGGEDGTARINIAVNPKTDVDFTASVSRTKNQQTPLSAGSLIDREFDTTLREMLEPELRRKITSDLTIARFALNGRWRPFSFMSASADLGWDRSNKSDLDILRRDDCVGVKKIGSGAGQCRYAPEGSYPDLGDGSYGTTQATRDVVSLNTRATFNVLSFAGITGPSTIGLNYSSSVNSEIIAKADGLLIGSTSLTGAKEIAVRDQVRDFRVAGIYLDQGLDFFGLTRTNLALRFDQGSGIGRNTSQPRFPKLGFSIPILVAGRSWYGVSLFRIRTAYGQSAVQPDVTAQLRTFVSDSNALVGSRPGLTIHTIGNTRLRPERSAEIEGGFELGLWQDRVNVTLNGYQKNTRDQHFDRTLPSSVNGGGSQKINLGNVRNTGIETSVDARLIERDAFSVAVNSNFAMNRNRLTKINTDVYSDVAGPSFGGGGVSGATRNVRGYPLNGWWTKPLVAYSDVDGSGSISIDELQLADSFVYVGTGQPKYEMNIRPTFGFFRNQLMLTAGFNYQHGMVRVNALSAIQSTMLSLDRRRVFNDTTVSLDDQAHALASTDASRPINVLRFQELSLSYNVPRSLTRHLRAGYMSVALQASNLRLWTGYTGKDPNVRSQTTDAPIDGGQLPQPRTWQLRLNLSR